MYKAKFCFYRGDSVRKGPFAVRLTKLHGQGSHNENDKLQSVTFSDNDKARTIQFAGP